MAKLREAIAVAAHLAAIGGVELATRRAFYETLALEEASCPVSRLAERPRRQCRLLVARTRAAPAPDPYYSLNARLFPVERRIEVGGAFDGAAADRARDDLTPLLGDRFTELRTLLI